MKNFLVKAKDFFVKVGIFFGMVGTFFKSLDKKTWLKIAGVVGLVGGCICFYLAGVTEGSVIAIVGAVFALIALIVALFGIGKEVN